MKKHLLRKTGILVCLFLGLFMVLAATTGKSMTLDEEIRKAPVNGNLNLEKSPNTIEGIQATFKWTIMIYMAADNDLEDAGVSDLNEMKIADFGGEICVIVEFDGWDSCLLQESDNINYNISQRFRVPGAGGAFINLDNTSTERNMGDAQTLRNFIEFSMTQFPADNYCLILWNHGLGWETGVDDWTDYASISSGANPSRIPQGVQRSLLTRQKGVCWDDRSFGDSLTETELKSALSNLPETLDVIAFDACLMGCVEVAYAIKDYAHYMVSSEDSIGLSGFYYTGFLDNLGSRSLSGSPTDYNPERCARVIVEETVDNQFANPELSMHITQLGVIDLTKLQILSDYISDLADVVLNMDNYQIKEVCKGVSSWADFVLSEQIDLWKVVDIINKASPGAIGSFGDDLLEQLRQTLVYQWFNNSFIQTACGLTIYSPWSPDLWIPNYSNVSAFGRESGWDEAVARMYAEADPVDSSDFILSHDNPTISNRIEQNELKVVFLTLHWKEKVTLKLSGPGSTDFDFYLFDFELNLIDESYEEDYPETIIHTSYEGAHSFILLIHAYQGSGDFSLKATYSTSNAMVEFLGCVNLFTNDVNNNTKIDDLQLVLAFDSPSSETVKFQIKILDHSSSIILEWSQKFIEGVELSVINLPYEELYQQIETLLPTPRWECLSELSIIEPTNWRYTFRDTPLTYLIKLSDLDPPVNANVVVTPGQIIELEPLNLPRTPSAKPKDNTFELIIVSIFTLAIVGGMGFWIMKKRTASAYIKTDQYNSSLKSTRRVNDIHYLAVCPSCGIVYNVQSTLKICPTCQVELQSIVR